MKNGDERCQKLESKVIYLNSLLENINEIFLTYNKKGYITMANKKAMEVFGYSSEEMLGKEIINFVYTEDRNKVKKEFKLRVDGGLAGNYEVRLTHKDGTPRYVRISASPIYDSGVVIGGSVLGEDITERKNMERELIQSEENYRTIFENTGTGMLILEENTIIALANSQAQRIVGYGKEEIENKKSWTEFVAVEDLEKMKEFHYARRQDPTSAPSAYEFRLVDKQGAIKNIYLNTAMIAGTKKNVVSIMDITGIKSIKRKLKESEEIYRTIFETTGTAMLILEDNTLISLANGQLEKISGYTRKEVEKKRNWMDFVAEKDLQMMKDNHFSRRKKADSSPSSYEFQLIGKEGNAIDILVNIAMIPGTNKSVASLMDITERKQAEQRLFAINEELGATLEQLTATEEELRYQLDLLQEKERQVRYVSLHDTLTGLKNRAYFEEEMRIMDSGRFNPLGLVICDVDGLKLVNDTMGHDAGDSLLIAAANVIKNSFRKGDIVARVGGDEFAVILPNTPVALVEGHCQKVYSAVAEYNANNPDLPLSISVGFSAKSDRSRGMDDLFREADNSMYRKKLHSSRSARSAIVHTLMKAIEARDHITEGHGERLQGLVAAMAMVMGLPERSIGDLRLLAQFHDIGKVGIPDRILFKKGRLTPLEYEEMRRHSEIGHRIAQSAPDMVPIAEWILLHHEWWNGEGYPLGLRGENIPLECRILAIADAYDAMTSDRPYRKAITHKDALAELRRCAGTQFEPELVEKFALVLEGLKK
ncbi:MAG: PAS domain S-box protein [Desulfocucumaceae bacterium]